MLNTDKYHFHTVDFNEPFSDLSFSNTTTENLTTEINCGIVIDCNLNFVPYLKMYTK